MSPLRRGIPLAIASVALLFGSPRLDSSAQEKTEPKAGERIVLLAEMGDSFVDRRIAAVDLDGKKLQPLTEQLPYQSQPGGFSVIPSWDGKVIAYLADGSSPPEGGLVTWTLFVRSVDEVKGKGRSLGVNNVTQIVVWSPDGKQLIASTRQNGDIESRQLLVDSKTGVVKELPLPKAIAPAESKSFSGFHITDWSPDANWFLASSTYLDKAEKWHRELYLVSSDGSAAKRLKHIPSGLNGKFSPNGRRILFVGQHQEGGKSLDQLYVVDVAGGEPVRVSQELDGMLLGHCWSPDGKRIAYVWDNREEGDANETFLMVVDADGKNPHVLCSKKSRGGMSFVSPSWR
jgi:Tol biopolymer transport system component